MSEQSASKEPLKSVKFLIELVMDETESVPNVASRLVADARRITGLARILSASVPPPSRYNFMTQMYGWEDWTP